jgi:hypothetical protein
MTCGGALITWPRTGDAGSIAPKSSTTPNDPTTVTATLTSADGIKLLACYFFPGSLWTIASAGPTGWTSDAHAGGLTGAPSVARGQRQISAVGIAGQVGRRPAMTCWPVVQARRGDHGRRAPR